VSKATVKQGSIGSASLWMIGLSILLFWIPTAGPLVAVVHPRRDGRGVQRRDEGGVGAGVRALCRGDARAGAGE
jgi:hypothetical protein